MSKEEQWAVSEAVEKSFAKMQRGYLRRRIIIITFLVILTLFVIWVGFILYVNYWPGNLSYGSQFVIELDEIALKAELARLEAIEKDYNFELSYERGRDKALLKMDGYKDEHTIQEYCSSKLNSKYAQYYVFDDIQAEVYYDYWNSSNKKNMLKYELPFFQSHIEVICMLFTTVKKLLKENPITSFLRSFCSPKTEICIFCMYSATVKIFCQS